MTATTSVRARSRRPRRTTEASVLFDAPGPRARLRNNILTLLGVVGLLALVYSLYSGLSSAGQFAPEMWKPFLEPQVWTGLIWPGLINTLSAAALAGVLSLIFGMIFGLARLSDHWWIRIPAGAVVEFFRAIPVLILIFLLFFAPGAMSGYTVTMTAYAAVVLGLMLYNGSVLAEVLRAGINSIPKGQSEAAYALGLRKGGVMRLILLPQAITAMMPAIVSQMVVVLKDTALGFIIAYEDLLNSGFRQIPANFNNIIPAAIVIAVVYILINFAVSYVATWLEKRSRRSPKSEAAPVRMDQNARLGGSAA